MNRSFSPKMSLKWILIVGLSNFGLVHEAVAQNQKTTDAVKQIITSSGLDMNHFSLQIKKDEVILTEINAKKKLIPASITKILTAYAVLKNFNYNAKFKTQLCSDNKNIYLVGGGDPGFVSENMWYLVNEFSRQGTSKIDGDIVVDSSFYDQTRYDESRESKRVDRSYDAPVGAMSFNWNSVNVFVTPNASQNRVQVYLDPENDYFTLKNSVKLSTKKNQNDIQISVDQKNRVIKVSGELSAEQGEKVYYKNVSNPALWSGLNLKAFLKQRGIAVQGQVRTGLLPGHAKCVVNLESKPLASLLADMNKFSNNFVAEMLTKNISAQLGEKPASLKTGVKEINQQVELLGIKKEDYTILNPSGFTRDNFITAEAMNTVLTAIKKDFKIYPSFIESLPLAGLDGTLKKRMKNSVAEGYVRAKTGYLDGVVSLAGYAGNAQGDVYTFTFIYNGPKDESLVRKTMDSILEKLLTSRL